MDCKPTRGPPSDYWSGLPFPSPGDLPDPGIEPRSPTLQADALTSVPPGKLSDEQIDINFINILKRTCMFYTFFYMEDTFK